MSITAREITRAAPGGLRRDLRIRQIDQETRTVEVAFASDAPVSRHFGEEVLEISATAIRRDRLNGGAAVLLNHDFDAQIGVVESVRIDRAAARATLRFGQGARASEVFQDVVDGIRRHVSVGYMVHAVEVEARDGQADLVTVTDWEPYEISIVAIPADQTVGVGRAAQPNRIEQMNTRNTTDTTDTNTTPRHPDTAPHDPDNRVADVLAMGRAYDNDALAARILREGGGPGEMQAALLRHMNGQGGAALSDGGPIGMNEREVQRFSVMRLVRALAAPGPDTAEEAAFELEASRAYAQRAGREPQGAFVPPDVLMSDAFARRDMTTGAAADGGSLVATQLLAGSFIDGLRDRLSVVAAGARFLPGLVGNVAIPRLSGGAAHEWLAEGGAVTDSQPSTDTVLMKPKTVATSIPMTRRLILQSTPAVEDMVRADLVARIALAIDGAALNGDASANAPEGLREIIAAAALDWATEGKPTFAEMVALETAVAEANADTGALGYIYGAAMGGHLKTTVIEAGAPVFIEGQDGQVNGYPRIKSNQAGTGDVFFGNFADLLIGTWSGLDIRADTATLASSDGLVVRAFQDVDVAVRHPESFKLGQNAVV